MGKEVKVQVRSLSYPSGTYKTKKQRRPKAEGQKPRRLEPKSTKRGTAEETSEELVLRKDQ